MEVQWETADSFQGRRRQERTRVLSLVPKQVVDWALGLWWPWEAAWAGPTARMREK